MAAFTVLVGLARAIRRQIGNTELGGGNSHPLEKNTAFKFCLFCAALNREMCFFGNQFEFILRQTNCNTSRIFDSFLFKQTIFF